MLIVSSYARNGVQLQELLYDLIDQIGMDVGFCHLQLFWGDLNQPSTQSSALLFQAGFRVRPVR